MTDPSEFYLSEDELRTRFEERVRDFVFGGYQPDDRLTLVLLGGQPAAGKSQAMAATAQRHAGRLVPLTGDELRPLHPRYRELLHADAQTRETATAQASGAWVRMSIEHALHEGYSLLLEGVFRDPAMTIGTAVRFSQSRFDVEVVALAVRAERSRLDALDRFLDGGRWTPPDLQNLAYKMVPETLAAAEASPAVRRISITNRDAADLYINERGPGSRWGSDPSAARELEAERARPFPSQEAVGWLVKYRSTVVEMAARSEVNDASRPVLRQLAVDAERVAVMADPDPASPVRLAHTAAVPLLGLLTEQTAAAALPIQLQPNTPFTAEGRAEAVRRAQLPQTARAAEDELRSALAVARHRLGSGPERPGPRRPDPAVARSRSSTTGGRPARKSGPSVPPSQGGQPSAPPEHRPRRGR
ncbi:zeta toxin family protein [Streptomyces sp. NPDC048387]|uniref:zeta toxin family protein n=1 Tax=Streptomyces sp. NPDC048387 TaxID=3365542 RepID=UPI00371D4D22